ncbi:TIM-barrel domain-containing protein [Hymenobacter sp. BT730]|uniref:TIM-barrel domain-containing protein n=1 Tax=Hymenobacter sp. BT730 TaxID=3063332 RepID=UPI0026E05D85|nr:TIM-barrel domain-containing protein [Hymenobacter sp. BT730]
MLRSVRRVFPLLFLLVSLTAVAQREGGGPPRKDPFGQKEMPGRAVGTGNYQSHTYQAGILTVVSSNGSTVQVRPWAEGVVRVEYFPAGQPVQEIPSVSVVQPASTWFRSGAGKESPEKDALPATQQPRNAGNVRATAQTLEWQTDGTTTVIIQKSPLRVSFLQAGKTLLGEVSGSFQRDASPTGTPAGLGVSFKLAPDEHLYGTGSRALPLDRRGRRIMLYNEAHYGYQNGEPILNVSLPTIVSSRGYMLFFDNHAPGTLDLGATEKNTLEYTGEGLRHMAYFLISGSSYPEMLSRYTALTGRQPLPPRWAMGLIQSRFGYQSEQEMYQVAARMRREGFPLDGLVLDLYWFGGTTRQGDFQWKQPNFSDPKRMIRRLDSAGVKTILITEPYIMRTSRNDAFVRKQGLVGRDKNGQPYTVESFWAGPATLMDMFKPQAREWMWQQYDRLKQDGVGGWWSDLGEPENQPADMVYDAGPTRRIHNAYGQAWASIISEGYAKHYPQERLFNLGRSGWAGMQRHSVFPWSGDVSRSWGGLQAQVPIMLSMGLGGVGYMHSDAGGFAGNTVDPELYTRWLQMASLGPILRPHGSGVPPEPYWFPEPYKSAVRDFTHLRYELLPYLYTLAWENSVTGTPLTRPMNFGETQLRNEPLLEASAEEPDSAQSLDAIESETSWGWSTKASSLWGSNQLQKRQQKRFLAQNKPKFTNINDQYFLGSNLLVAPVIQPGQRRRNVVLPAGNWIDFHTHETLPGSQTVGRTAPLARIPVLVRSGAILPMAPYVNTTARYRTDTLRVRFYADPCVGQSSFTMYEDDGKSALAQQQNAYQLIAFAGNVTATGTSLRVAVHGSYPGAPTQRTVELLIPRVATAPAAVLLQNTALPAAAWQYDAASQSLRLRFPLSKQPVVISIPGLQLNTTPATNSAPEVVTLEAPNNRTFSGSVRLPYTLFVAGQYPLVIKNAAGEIVKSLPTETFAGSHTITWNADDQLGQPVPGGVYWAEMNGQHQRLVLLR